MKNQQTPISSITHILNYKGWIDIPSSGVSMYPLISKGNICRFIPLDVKNDLKKGDILLYVSEYGQLIGHRLCAYYVRDSRRYYICKGDSNVCFDPPINETQIIGKLMLIKKRSYSLRAEGTISHLWRKIISHYPVLPRLCMRIFTTYR